MAAEKGIVGFFKGLFVAEEKGAAKLLTADEARSARAAAARNVTAGAVEAEVKNTARAAAAESRAARGLRPKASSAAEREAFQESMNAQKAAADANMLGGKGATAAADDAARVVAEPPLLNQVAAETAETAAEQTAKQPGFWSRAGKAYKGGIDTQSKTGLTNAIQGLLRVGRLGVETGFEKVGLPRVGRAFGKPFGVASFAWEWKGLITATTLAGLLADTAGGSPVVRTLARTADSENWLIRNTIGRLGRVAALGLDGYSFVSGAPATAAAEGAIAILENRGIINENDEVTADTQKRILRGVSHFALHKGNAVAKWNAIAHELAGTNIKPTDIEQAFHLAVKENPNGDEIDVVRGATLNLVATVRDRAAQEKLGVVGVIAGKIGDGGQLAKENLIAAVGNHGGIAPKLRDARKSFLQELTEGVNNFFGSGWGIFLAFIAWGLMQLGMGDKGARLMQYAQPMMPDWVTGKGSSAEVAGTAPAAKPAKSLASASSTRNTSFANQIDATSDKNASTSFATAGSTLVAQTSNPALAGKTLASMGSEFSPSATQQAYLVSEAPKQEDFARGSIFGHNGLRALLPDLSFAPGAPVAALG